MSVKFGIPKHIKHLEDLPRKLHSHVSSKPSTVTLYFGKAITLALLMRMSILGSSKAAFSTMRTQSSSEGDQGPQGPTTSVLTIAKCVRKAPEALVVAQIRNAQEKTVPLASFLKTSTADIAESL